MTFVSPFQFHIYLSWVNICLTSVQPEEGLSRETSIFVNVCLKLYCSLSRLCWASLGTHVWTIVEIETRLQLIVSTRPPQSGVPTNDLCQTQKTPDNCGLWTNLYPSLGLTTAILSPESTQRAPLPLGEEFNPLFKSGRPPMVPRRQRVQRWRFLQDSLVTGDLPPGSHLEQRVLIGLIVIQSLTVPCSGERGGAEVEFCRV